MPGIAARPRSDAGSRAARLAFLVMVLPSVASAAPARLDDADVAPCRVGPSARGKGPIQLEAWVVPDGGTAFQTFICAGSPTDVDWLDYGSADDVEWVLPWFRQHLWSGRDPDHNDPARLLRKGASLAVLTSPRPSPLEEILRKRGWSDSLGVPAQRALRDANDADVRRWKKLATCDLPGRAGVCEALAAFAVGKQPVRITKPAVGAALQMAPGSDADGHELHAWLRLGKGEVNFGVAEGGTAELTKRAATKGAAAQRLDKSVGFEKDGRVVLVRETTKGLVVVSLGTTTVDLVVASFPR
jgi:hypothetical protein